MNGPIFREGGQFSWQIFPEMVQSLTKQTSDGRCSITHIVRYRPEPSSVSTVCVFVLLNARAWWAKQISCGPPAKTQCTSAVSCFNGIATTLGIQAGSRKKSQVHIFPGECLRRPIFSYPDGDILHTSSMWTHLLRFAYLMVFVWFVCTWKYLWKYFPPRPKKETKILRRSGLGIGMQNTWANFRVYFLKKSWTLGFWSVEMIQWHGTAVLRRRLVVLCEDSPGEHLHLVEERFLFTTDSEI